MMLTPQGNRRFLLWLSLTTAALAVGLAVMLALFQRQARSIEETARLQVDSMTALAFQFEREYLRLRGALELSLSGREPPDWPALQLRYEIFLSRIDLLRRNPTTQRLQDRPEYTALMPVLDGLVARGEPLMQNPAAQLPGLRAWLADLRPIAPDVQALSLAANSLTSRLIEDQLQTVRDQSRLITALMAVQVVALLAAASSLALRQRRQMREREALERLNAELREAKRQADSANRGKSQFLANMSHELRTPFNGMLGMMEMLEDSGLTPQQQDHLQTARDSARHLLTLLNDILDMSALEAGKLKVQPQPVEMQRLLADTRRLMQAQAERKGLVVELLLPPETGDWPDWVLSDPTRLRQILFNLLNNAIKFTEQGRVELEVACQRHGASTIWTFVVRDTGIGMSAETLARLFQRFEQADNSATRRFGGSGLGLEISRSLARLMGGDIEAASVPGQGSTFTVTLPAPVGDAPPGPALPPVPAPPATGPAPGPATAPPSRTVERAPTAMALPPLHPAPATPATGEPASAPASSTAPAGALAGAVGLSLLVAEDHPVNRKFVGTLLDKLGHRVTFAENGREAVDLVQQFDFDLVFMDVHMPEMDGLTATRHIRAMDGRKGSLPIVALTADVMNEARERALQAGVDEFISKPVQKERLALALAQWVGKPRG